MCPRRCEKSGVVPFTIAVAAAGNVNAGALNMDGIRALAEERREKERRTRHGMEIEDDGVAPGGLMRRLGRCSRPWTR